MVRALGPVAMTCMLVVASASSCGENGSDVTPSTAPSTTEAECPNVPVVVATKDISAGTTGAQATANGMLREEEIPGRYRPATAIMSLDQVADGVATADLSANEIVSFEHFGLPSDTTMVKAAPSCPTDAPSTTAGN